MTRDASTVVRLRMVLVLSSDATARAVLPGLTTACVVACCYQAEREGRLAGIWSDANRVRGRSAKQGCTVIPNTLTSFQTRVCMDRRVPRDTSYAQISLPRLALELPSGTDPDDRPYRSPDRCTSVASG